MTDAGRSELYFIAGMMVLILILCTVAVIVFFKTYRKEMREKVERREAKHAPEQSVSND